MRTDIAYGTEHLELEIGDDRLVAARAQPHTAPVLGPVAAVADALESPLGFPALRRALTPDDHVAVVVDEQLPLLPQMLAPILAHVTGAGVRPEAITLLCAAPSSQEWVDDLPDEFQEVRVEVHDPAERKR